MNLVFGAACCESPASPSVAQERENAHAVDLMCLYSMTTHLLSCAVIAVAAVPMQGELQIYSCQRPCAVWTSLSSLSVQVRISLQAPTGQECSDGDAGKFFDKQMLHLPSFQHLSTARQLQIWTLVFIYRSNAAGSRHMEQGTTTAPSSQWYLCKTHVKGMRSAASPRDSDSCQS